MIIIRQKQKIFSSAVSVLNNTVDRLRRDGVRDFDVDVHPAMDCISINTDLNNLVIYLPQELEFSQFSIDAFIRSMIPYARTDTRLDRNIYVMKVFGRLTEAQYVKLVKFIIKDNEFCVILEP